MVGFGWARIATGDVKAHELYFDATGVSGMDASRRSAAFRVRGQLGVRRKVWREVGFGAAGKAA